jgi:hypothetical protein
MKTFLYQLDFTTVERPRKIRPDPEGTRVLVYSLRGISIEFPPYPRMNSGALKWK